jgi:CHASE2 domain-containing sensor protein
VKRRLRRHLRELTILAALLSALVVGTVQWGWLDRVDFWLYDTTVALSGRPAPHDILILSIDEDSLSRWGRWPWSRRVLGNALNRLTEAGAGPVLLDVIFSGPQRDDPEADLQLAAAMQRHGRVVLPMFMVADGQDEAVLPEPGLVAAARLGHSQALVDSDGVSRRYMPQEFANGVAYPHVAQVLWDLVQPQNKTAVAQGGARLAPFAGPPGHFERRSFTALMEGRVPTKDIEGRIVLVGATATGLGDNLITPLAGTNGTMPGVEFIANVLDGLLHDLAPKPLGGVARLALSLLFLWGLLLLLLVTSPRVALFTTAMACVGVALASGALLKWGSIWIPPAAPIAAMALAYPLWSWRRLEASLSALTRETGRIATLSEVGRARPLNRRAGGFFDPVESRIHAITHAVDNIAAALTTDGSTPEARQHREDMMRHLVHDLRSPLLSLRSLADNLRGDRAENQAQMLARVDACARRALDLSEQFLLMGRADALNPASFAEVDLVQILHQSADDLWEDANTQGARIVRRCALDCVPVRGDARLLQRVLLNLGWNALRHGPRTGTVTLSLEATPQGYLLAVHDQGAGFEDSALGALSERYAQGSTASAGHGLGLALVRQVADKHQITVSADHPPHGGFQVNLLWHSAHAIP